MCHKSFCRNLQRSDALSLLRFFFGSSPGLALISLQFHTTRREAV